MKLSTFTKLFELYNDIPGLTLTQLMAKDIQALEVFLNDSGSLEDCEIYLKAIFVKTPKEVERYNALLKYINNRNNAIS